MASDFKDLVRNQQWYRDEIEQAAEARAMELLGGLLDETPSGDSATVVGAVVISEPEKVPEKTRAVTYRFSWHNDEDADAPGNNHGGHLTTYGPKGEKLEVKKGKKRTSQLHWWHAYVNGIQIERCLKQSDAKSVAEYAVTGVK